MVTDLSIASIDYQVLEKKRDSDRSLIYTAKRRASSTLSWSAEAKKSLDDVVRWVISTKLLQKLLMSYAIKGF